MNERQIEEHLHMIMQAIGEIAAEIQHQDPAGESLNLFNRKAVELATEIALEVQREKRHADNMKLGYDILRSVDVMTMRLANRL